MRNATDLLEHIDEIEATSGRSVPSEKPDAEVLIKQADDLCSLLSKISQDRLEDKKQYAMELVAAIYGLHIALSPMKSAYNAFLQERGVEPGKRSNEFSDTAKAVMEQHASTKKRATVTLYAQACHVLKMRAIDPTQAVQWLNEPDQSGGNRGKGRTGFGKTKRLWSNSPEGLAERAKKSEAEKNKAKEYLNEKRQASADSSSAYKTSMENLPIPGETGIALIECSESGEWQVSQVLTRNVVKTAQTVKTCLSATDVDQEAAA